MSDDRTEREVTFANMPDSELARIVADGGFGTDESQMARYEMARRGLRIPRAGSKKDLLGGLSPISAVLFLAAGLYVLALKFVPAMGSHVRLSPSVGLALACAMLWSVAWDARSRSASDPNLRRWPRKLVAWVGVLTVVAVASAVWELAR